VEKVLQTAQQADPSITSLVITHRLSNIQSDDIIYVMNKGRLIENGTHEELIDQHGIYYSMLSVNRFEE